MRCIELTLSVVSFKIEREIDRKLEKIATRQNTSKSELIRKAVQEYLSKHYTKEKRLSFIAQTQDI